MIMILERGELGEGPSTDRACVLLFVALSVLFLQGRVVNRLESLVFRLLATG